MFVPFPYSYNATVDAGSTALVGICGAQVSESFIYVFRLCIYVFPLFIYMFCLLCMCVPFPYSYNTTVDAGLTALVAICGAQVVYLCAVGCNTCSVSCICVFRFYVRVARRLIPGQRPSFAGHRLQKKSCIYTFRLLYICVPFAISRRHSRGGRAVYQCTVGCTYVFRSLAESFTYMFRLWYIYVPCVVYVCSVCCVYMCSVCLLV